MRKVPALLLAACLAVCLAGCNAEQEGQLCRIRFERGHGSAWGTQFTVEVCPEEITEIRYIPAGTSEPETAWHIPITTEQWETLCAAIGSLELKEERVSFWHELFGGAKADGGAYRKLTLYWKTDRGEKAVAYVWPQSPQAQTAEKLLEELIMNIGQGG